MQVSKKDSLNIPTLQRPVFLLSAARMYCAFCMTFLLDTVQKKSWQKVKKGSLLTPKLPTDIAVLRLLIPVLGTELLDVLEALSIRVSRKLSLEM